MEPQKTIQTRSIHVCLGNEKSGHIEELQRHADGNKAIEWTINSKAKDGDIAAFYIKRPISSFVAYGRVRGESYRSTDPNWPDQFMAMIEDLLVLPEPLHYSLFEFGDWHFTPPQQSMRVPVAYRDKFWKILANGQEDHGSTANTIDSMSEKESLIESNNPEASTAIGGQEGGLRSVIVTRAERNPKNRKDCLNHWGYKCRVCSFDFGQVFGGVANEYIHVHHHNPLAFSGEIVSDPVNDMSPLCPNCHAVAHLHVPPYSIEELIAFRFNAEHGNKELK